MCNDKIRVYRFSFMAEPTEGLSPMKLTQIARIVCVAGALLCLGLLCAMWRAPEAASHLHETATTGARSVEHKSMKIRDRIEELRRVRARDLRPNPRNWRVHPKPQVDALRSLLSEIGYADALIARELPDGSLELIDGHLRA